MRIEAMNRRIYLADVEGKPAVCFNTGLDPRSFARTKMSQSLIEPGYIVYPDGTHEVWKSSGVSEVNGSMRVWGPTFAGERLDFLLNQINSTDREKTLLGIIYWIRAKMLLGDVNSSLNPGAAFICFEDGDSKFPKGTVFFVPKNLSNRCLLMEGTEIDRFNCPDLAGMEAAAFCAGAMLYKILANTFPYQNDATIFQDMREGVFLPPNLAAPGLDEKLCGIIQSAFMLPVEKRGTNESGLDIIGKLLNLLMENENQTILVASLFKQFPKEEYARLEKEKKSFLFRQNIFVNTKRFSSRNRHAIIGTAAGFLFLIFVIASTSNSFKQRPTTAGMASDTVIMAYFEAFSSLDHMLMEACIQGADKSDINVAASFFAISKTRQAYERTDTISIIPARVWRDTGGELPSPSAFGVTDLVIKYLAGTDADGMMMYQADYLVWSPDLDYPIKRTDRITLKLDRKKNWRITEILRDEAAVTL